MASYFLVEVLPSSCRISNMRLTWALLLSRPSRRATVSFLRSASSSPISSWSHAESWATLLGLDRPESRTASAVRFWRTVSPRYRAPVTSSRSTATPRALMMRSVSHCFCTQSGGINAESRRSISISVTTSCLQYSLKSSHFAGSCWGRLRVLWPLAFVGLQGMQK